MKSILGLLSIVTTILGFAPQPSFRSTASHLHLRQKENLGSAYEESYDPMGFSLKKDLAPQKDTFPTWLAPATASTAVALLSFSNIAIAITPSDWSTMTPQTFQPVCPASDGFYRFLQGTTESVVGKENFVEYGPLIAGGLLRVRLELCVVESFFQEAVGPFIHQNGLSWILPLHETVETFLAGTIFALATTFILVGSTKLVTVIVTYADVFVGAPSRLLGGFAFDRARGKPITLDIGFGPFKTRIVGPPDEEMEKEKPLLEDANPAGLAVAVASGSLKSVGEASKILREVMEALDLFVGRYLVLIATGYIGIKFIHFKVFPDFPF